MSDVQKESAFGSAEDRLGQILGHTIHHESPDKQLQDQLESLLFQREDEEIDSEALSELLEQLDEVSPLPVELDVEESLKNFHQRYAPVFDAVRTETVPEKTVSVKKRRSRLALGKIIVIAAALMLLLCTTAQAMGLDVFSTIARWTSEVFGLGGQSASFASVQKNPLSEGEEMNFDSLEEAMAAFGIEAPLVPKKIPERFELVSVTANRWFTGVCLYADYSCEDGFLHMEYREIPGQNHDSVEKEYGDVVPYTVRRIKHYLSSDLQRWKALWVNGDFECQVYGIVSEQELKDMIDSIYWEG